MRRLGILVAAAVLVAGCGASRAPIYAAPTAQVLGFDALASAKGTAYDGLKVAPAGDDARTCKCSAVTATNEKYEIAMQAADDQLLAVKVNGKALVEAGELVGAKAKEDADLALDQADEIDAMLGEATKGGTQAKVASRMLQLARIYSGLQKAEVVSKAKTAFSDVKKAMRVFIKANTPAKDKGQIGV